MSSISGNNNTAVGYNAMLAVSSGSNNTAIGNNAMNGSGVSPTVSYCTAVGDSALYYNTANNMVAVGASALLKNSSGTGNTAVGYYALSNNTIGTTNTVFGYQTMTSAPNSTQNTAMGYQALMNDNGTTGNTAVGYQALANVAGPGSTYVGSQNSAFGLLALNGNTTGFGNVAVGAQAAEDITSGSQNVVVGQFAASNLTTGYYNIVIGSNTGTGLSTANNVIIIGKGLAGGNTSGTTFIGGISGVTAISGGAVYINSSGQLGTASSSKRYKENIQELGDVSKNIYKFRPVQFNYINDSEKWFEAGLIAEEVEVIMPEIVVYKDDQPETVRYQHLPIMILNEVQQHQKVILELQEQNATLLKRIETLESKLS
jgi:hypothetical protein